MFMSIQRDMAATRMALRVTRLVADWSASCVGKSTGVSNRIRTVSGAGGTGSASTVMMSCASSDVPVVPARQRLTRR